MHEINFKKIIKIYKKNIFVKYESDHIYRLINIKKKVIKNNNVIFIKKRLISSFIYNLL